MNNCDFCIEIKGHINLPNRPNCELDTRHYKLSVDRAEMVFGNMISRGIVSERMLPKGYGNWEMLYPKATVESNMAKNRRVEIKIIDCNSEALISIKKK
jgi:flagellar motor protein MotB